MCSKRPLFCMTKAPNCSRTLIHTFLNVLKSILRMEEVIFLCTLLSQDRGLVYLIFNISPLRKSQEESNLGSKLVISQDSIFQFTNRVILHAAMVMKVLHLFYDEIPDRCTFCVQRAIISLCLRDRPGLNVPNDASHFLLNTKGWKICHFGGISWNGLGNAGTSYAAHKKF